MRDLEMKMLLELLNKLKVEIKYQTVKDVRTLYVSNDDTDKIEKEILAERNKH